MSLQESDQKPESERKSLDDLFASIERGTSLDRLLMQRTIEKARSSDPELADLLAACGIPRYLDVGVVGTLRQNPDTQSNAEFLSKLARYSFVVRKADGRCVYHDTTREALLEEWQSEPAKRAQFDELNERLTTYFVGLYQAASEVQEHLARVADLIKTANKARFLQLAGIVEQRLTAPLGEAIYHAKLRSTEAVCDLLISQFESNEQDGRLTLWLLQRTSDIVAALRSDESTLSKVLWLRYWEARALGAVGQFAESESKLRRLLDQVGEDAKLKLWTLGSLGNNLDSLDRLQEAREFAQEQLHLALVTREDVYNLPVSYSRVARCHAILENFDAAIVSYREAIASARELDEGSRNHSAEIYARLGLAAAHRSIGGWREAVSEIVIALHLARKQMRTSRDVNLSVAMAIMATLGRFHPDIADAAYQEGLVLCSADPQLRAQLDIDYSRTLEDMGKLAQSVDVIERLIADQGDSGVSPDMLLRRASLHESYGERARAIELQDKIVNASAGARWTKAAALSNRGMGYVALGQWDRARADIQNAWEEWQAMGHAQLASLMVLVKAEINQRTGEYEEAERMAKESSAELQLSRSAHAADLHTTLGLIYRDSARWQDADEHFQQALGICRGLMNENAAAQVCERLAGVNSQRGLWDRSAEFSDQAKQIWSHLALIAGARPTDDAVRAAEESAAGMQSFTYKDDTRENLSRARDLFQSASRSAPANPLYLLNLASACAELRDWGDAARAIAAILDLGYDWMPTNWLNSQLADYRLRHADALHAAGRHREAVDLLASSRDDPSGGLSSAQLAAGLSRTGDCLLELGEVDAAERKYRELVSLATHESEGYLRLALVAAIRGQLGNAVDLCNQGIAAADTVKLDSLLTATYALPLGDEACRVLDSALRLARSAPGLDSVRKSRVANAMLQVLVKRPHRTHATTSVYVRTPIILEADDRLFPDGNQAPGVAWMIDIGIPAMRDRLRNSTGVQVPGVRIRGSYDVPEGAYKVMLMEQEWAGGVVRRHEQFCVDGRRCHELGLTGVAPQVSPAFGLDEGRWLNEIESARAARAELPLWDEYEFMLRHVEALLHAQIAAFIDVKLVNDLLRSFESEDQRHSELVRRAVPDDIALIRLAELLRQTAMRGHPVNDLAQILTIMPDAQAQSTQLVGSSSSSSSADAVSR